MNCHASYSSLLTHLLSSGCGELFPFHTFKLCMCHVVSELPHLHMFFQCLIFFPCHVFFSPFCVTPVLICCFLLNLHLPFWPFPFHFVFRTFFEILHSFLKHAHTIFLFCFLLLLFCLYGFPFCSFQRSICAGISVPVFALVSIHVHPLCVNTDMC